MSELFPQKDENPEIGITMKNGEVFKATPGNAEIRKYYGKTSFKAGEVSSSQFNHIRLNLEQDESEENGVKSYCIYPLTFSYQAIEAYMRKNNYPLVQRHGEVEDEVIIGYAEAVKRFRETLPDTYPEEWLEESA
jgi:hypothetical protein